MPARILAVVTTLILALVPAAAQDSLVLRAGQLVTCTLEEPNFSSVTARPGEPVLCYLWPLREFGRSVFPRGRLPRRPPLRLPGPRANRRERVAQAGFRPPHSALGGDSHYGQARLGAVLAGGRGGADAWQRARRARRALLVNPALLAYTDRAASCARSATGAQRRGAADAAPPGRHRNSLHVLSKLRRRIRKWRIPAPAISGPLNARITRPPRLAQRAIRRSWRARPWAAALFRETHPRSCGRLQGRVPRRRTSAPSHWVSSASWSPRLSLRSRPASSNRGERGLSAGWQRAATLPSR